MFFLLPSRNMEVKFLAIESCKNQEIDYAMQTNLSHTEHLQDFGGMLTGFIIPVLLHLTRLLIWWLELLLFQKATKGDWA